MKCRAAKSYGHFTPPQVVLVDMKIVIERAGSIRYWSRDVKLMTGQGDGDFLDTAAKIC